MAEVYYIEEYQTHRNTYKGHYPHYDTKVATTQEEVTRRKGSYLVKTEDQDAYAIS